ncbi:MAG: TonB-dependent receptor [Pseudomonadales bacterium]|nr:TonB-dependent receptor [Pseudomonadales bacterium]
MGADFQLSWVLGAANKMLAGMALERQEQRDVELWTNNGSGPLVNISDVANWNGDQQREIVAFYLQDIWDIQESARLIAGVRFDHYDDFGNTVNPRASVSWDLSNSVQTIATYGSAFRAPTFGELYNINNPSIVGNPDVEAEEIETFEFGLRFKLNRRTELKSTLFHNHIENLIEPRASNSAVSYSDNIGKKEVTGIETEFAARLESGSKVVFNHTYQDAENKLDKSRAVDVPLHRINLLYYYRYSRYLNAFAGILYEGSLNHEKNDARSDLSEIATLDLALTWTNRHQDLMLTASLYNALDEDVVEPSPAGVMESDYPSAGRNFILKIEFNTDAL